VKRLIISIGHKARQGKDTAALHLQKVFGCRIIHFADALYDECKHSTILYKDNPPTLFLKTYDEDFFHFPNPGETIINWIKQNALPRDNLPFGAQLYYGGMKEKDGTLLQFWGTEFRRKRFSWDYWVDKVRDEIVAHPDDDYIIPDTRFKNEAKMVKEMGGFVWKIIRVGYQAADRDPDHTSEIDLDEWDFDAVILNDGTIPELCAKAETQFRKLKGLPHGTQTCTNQ